MSAAQVFELHGGTFQFFRDLLMPGEEVEVRFSATGPVDVFFVDESGFELLRNGQPFSDFGRHGFISGFFTFAPQQAGQWNLVCGNPSTPLVTVTLNALTLR